jgi:threonyl-tRNA synthetase
LKFDDAEGKDTFWHSSAHVLGQALEQEYGCHLTIGETNKSIFQLLVKVEKLKTSYGTSRTTNSQTCYFWEIKF